jgi:hypothetical protein
VQGRVPEGKDPRAIDRKLIAKYGADQTEGARYRRKSQGLANIQYVRHERTWLLLATHGEHRLKIEEAKNLRDVRKVPIVIGGYSLNVRRGEFLKKKVVEDTATPDGRNRVRVLIAREAYRKLRARLLGRCCHLSAEALGRDLWNVPFEPYAPVRKQLLKLLRAVNEKRRQAGLSKIPPTVLRLRREIVRPFEPKAVSQAA